MDHVKQSENASGDQATHQDWVADTIGLDRRRPRRGSGAFAYFGGWFSPDALTSARIVDRFEQIDGVHAGFRRNHAKGVGVSGFFESNGNGVRLSKAAVFEPRRVPVIGRFSLDGGQPYQPDRPDTRRGLGLQFSLPNGELWRTAMINFPLFPVRTPEIFYERLLAFSAGPRDREARSRQGESI